MRRDVKNVIAERPKSNRTWQNNTPRKKAVVVDGEGEQFDESTNHLLQKRQKMRATRFNVLKGFLNKKLGRPWNTVFAEACRNADSRTLQGSEIREMLKELVATECWLEGRKIMSHDFQGASCEVSGFYVHPKSGLLLRKEQRL